MRVIFDNDAGPDDLMALAYLLACPDVHIEAITTAYGLAHTERGAHNILRFLTRCGRSDIPVYVGQDYPLRGTAAFPDRWRKLSNDLPGVALPDTTWRAEDLPAADYLRRRTGQDSTPVRILATGALTNISELCDAACPALEDIVIMGGAFEVPGNVIDSGNFISPTKTAEWNIHVDPLAASNIFSSHLKQTIIPLDATNQVPVTPDFIDAFGTSGPGILHRAAYELLELIRPYAAIGTYYAWDPLAAVALLDPLVVSTKRRAITVTLDMGTTRYATSGPLKSVAVSADQARWEAAFVHAF